MAIIVSQVLKDKGRLLEWASKMESHAEDPSVVLSEEDKGISEAITLWANQVADNGDRNHELSALIKKVITPEVVEAPSALIDALFDTDTIGEFDTYRADVEGENTYQAYEAVPGGNVDRSFIDETYLKPQWISLQVETDIPFRKIRRNGSAVVSKALLDMKDKIELTKSLRAMNAINNAVPMLGAASSNSMPTEAEIDTLNLYLMDEDDGDGRSIFALNKYIQAISKLPAAGYYASETVKDKYMSSGLLSMYSGTELYGFSGTKKINGEFVIPDKTIFGAAGKIGIAVTRGETLSWTQDDINAEKVHIKLRGASFGFVITKPEKATKIVMA